MTTTTSTPATTAPGGDLRHDPCPVSPVIDVVFSRWTTPILWLLQHQGPLRFNAVRDALGTVTPKTLTQRLRQLERDGLITRTQHLQVPPRVDYEITTLGLSLSPVFRMLVDWSADKMPSVQQSRAHYDESGRPMPA